MIFMGKEPPRQYKGALREVKGGDSPRSISERVLDICAGEGGCQLYQRSDVSMAAGTGSCLESQGLDDQLSKGG